MNCLFSKDQGKFASSSLPQSFFQCHDTHSLPSLGRFSQRWPPSVCFVSLCHLRVVFTPHLPHRNPPPYEETPPRPKIPVASHCSSKLCPTSSPRWPASELYTSLHVSSLHTSSLSCSLVSLFIPVWSSHAALNSPWSSILSLFGSLPNE